VAVSARDCRRDGGPVERVTLVKPVRVGFTTLLTGAIGNFIANEPAPILAFLPTKSEFRTLSRSLPPRRPCGARSRPIVRKASARYPHKPALRWRQPQGRGGPCTEELEAPYRAHPHLRRSCENSN
jgi:hypothetical protein